MKTIATLIASLGTAFSLFAGEGKNTPSDDQIAQNTRDYQLDCGGWQKKKNMKKPCPADYAATRAKSDKATIDNNATTTQIRFLAGHFTRTGDERSKASAVRGIEWLLRVQMPNGGWAQYPERKKGYWTQITFNDRAMELVLSIMYDVARGEGGFAWADDGLRKRCRAAFDRGLACVLACQIRVDGKPTVWCQQHDRETLAPVDGRAYELASFCSQESAHLVEFLKTVENPSPELRASIDGAVEWFRRTRLPDGRWARFYDLKECKPFFCDRSGIPKRSVEEIDPKRQRGYKWFNTAADKLL